MTHELAGKVDSQLHLVSVRWHPDLRRKHAVQVKGTEASDLRQLCQR
jgi:hypothetical protein